MPYDLRHRLTPRCIHLRQGFECFRFLPWSEDGRRLCPDLPRRYDRRGLHYWKELPTRIEVASSALSDLGRSTMEEKRGPTASWITGEQDLTQRTSRQPSVTPESVLIAFAPSALAVITLLDLIWPWPPSCARCFPRVPEGLSFQPADSGRSFRSWRLLPPQSPLACVNAGEKTSLYLVKMQSYQVGGLNVATAEKFKVSSSGQMSLPAAVRR